MSILTLNDEESLGRVVDHHDTVVIDFWAPWCAPCKGFLPVLEKASEDHPDVVFCRVNTEEHKDLAQAFEVKSIPMLPNNVLEDLIAKVKKLDMDEVRREMEQSEEQKGNGS
jgi:thiol-disulfide isomerase/thioredoxin